MAPADPLRSFARGHLHPVVMSGGRRVVMVRRIAQIRCHRHPNGVLGGVHHVGGGTLLQAFRFQPVRVVLSLGAAAIEPEKIGAGADLFRRLNTERLNVALVHGGIGLRPNVLPFPRERCAFLGNCRAGFARCSGPPQGLFPGGWTRALKGWCPRPELNRNMPFRKRPLYPFELRGRTGSEDGAKTTGFASQKCGLTPPPSKSTVSPPFPP
jgi:hypothetical protein